MNEARRIVRYLIGTKNSKLQLSKTGCGDTILAYSDADWAEDKRDRKSNTGMICTINGGVVSWSCRKQSVVSLSTAEAEYVALAETCKEVIWLTRIAEHFGITETSPITMFTDNQSAKALTDNNRFSQRSKHIDTKFHFIRDISEKGIVSIKYHPIETNIADMLTKPLGGNKIRQLRELAGLKEEHTSNAIIELEGVQLL